LQFLFPNLLYVRKRLDAKQAAKKLHDKSPCEHPFEKDGILYM